MIRFEAITAVFVISITVASAQNYLSRGWKRQDVRQYPDIVHRINRVLTIASGIKTYDGISVLALHTKSANSGLQFFVIYQDGTDTPCRLSWNERRGGPSDIIGPNCGFAVSNDGDKEGDLLYDNDSDYLSGARSGGGKTKPDGKVKPYPHKGG